MRECWKRLPGTPHQSVQDIVLGALETKSMEGHNSEWRAGLYKGMGIFSPEINNLATNTSDQKENDKAMTELQNAKRIIKRAGYF